MHRFTDARPVAFANTRSKLLAHAEPVTGPNTEPVNTEPVTGPDSIPDLGAKHTSTQS